MSLVMPDLAAAVAADFAARGIDAQALFGDWQAADHNAGNRVIIGAATTFEDADLGPANAPGLQDLGEGDAGARTLFTIVEYANVWCHCAPVGDESSPTRLADTYKATRRLVAATLAAMYRAAPGAFGWGGGAFLKPEVAEHRFGAVATFRIQILTPVFDDAYPLVTPTGYNGQFYATTPNEGDVLVGEINQDAP